MSSKKTHFLLTKRASLLLQNKGAIITGGARGIGFAIAKELIRQKATVVICSRTKSELNKALKLLNGKNKVAFGIVCDVLKLSDCKKLINFAEKKLKKIDILVNNAGIYGPIGPLKSLNLKDFKKTIEINLMGMVYLSNLVIPLMEKNNGGKIINLCGAGVGGSKTMPNFSAYFTSKFAVAGFSEVLADELAEKNILVNAISPGAVNTHLNNYLLKQGPKRSGKEIYEKALELKKSGGTPPIFAAKLVAYLSSNNSNHITGRLLSAKWNPPEKLIQKQLSNNLYKLRRVDQEFIHEKS